MDRDERPDVDRRYEQAVSALTGQGGWPLIGFLTLEGKVFYMNLLELHGQFTGHIRLLLICTSLMVCMEICLKLFEKNQK